MKEDPRDAGLTALFPSIAVQLRGALSNIHLAAASLATPEQREQDPRVDAKAALLEQNYYQLLRLVNNLSAVAYLEPAGPLPVQDRDIAAIVRTQCEKVASLAELLGLQFQFRCQEESHLCAVYRDSIEQLLFQLLSNAFKFTPRGGSVTVELRFLGNQVFLSVSDTGCGIPEELIPTLFDRYQHRELMNPPPHGLGLGLALCRRIAEGHGGSILAESRVGKGSQFTVSLPDRQTGISGLADPGVDYAGGFNQTLLALSDALPREAFLHNNLD